MDSGENDGHQQIVLSGGDGKSLEPLTPANGNAESPSFSPDGEQIVYAVGQGDYESAGPTGYTLWIMRSDGSGRSRVTGPDNWDENEYSQQPEQSDNNPVWSPVNDEIVFSHYGPLPSEPNDPAVSGTGLYLLTPGETPRRLTESGGGRVDGSATWSPDGEHIAFIRREEPSGGPIAASLMVIDRDGTNLTRVAEAASNWVEAVLWSPDGKSILLGGGQSVSPIGNLPVEESLRPSLVNSSRRVDLATGEVTAVGAQVGRMQWSADGERLYATLAGIESGFVAMDVGGNDGTSVTHDGRPLVDKFEEFDVTACA